MKGARSQVNGFSIAASVSAFLFFAMALSVPSGYSYGAGLLCLASLLFFIRKRTFDLSTEDRTLAILLLAVFVVSLFSFLLHENSSSSMDQPSRYLLALPILIFLINNPPSLPFIWAGLITGGLSAGGVTLWQLNWMGVERATGFVTSAIPYGDINLTIAILCLAGLFWAGTLRRHAWLWRIALTAAALASFYSFIASETRGGWLALPFVAPLFYIGFARTYNIRKLIVMASIIFVALSVALAVTPNKGTKARYVEAINEAQMYWNSDSHAATNAVGGRLAAWATALNSIAEKPVTGWSHKEYEEKLRDLSRREKIDPYVASLANTHNQYIEILLYQGLIGLLALLFLYGYAFRFFYLRIGRPDVVVRVLAVSGASLLTSFFMYGMTHVILGRNNGIIFFLITLLIFWSSMLREEKSAGLRLTQQI